MNIKKGDKIRCISLPDAGYWFNANPVTLNKIYICDGIKGEAVFIHNDNDNRQGYYYYRFIKVNDIVLNTNIHII
jgi:hypothetical protein